jgi:hypothetical protein
VCRLVEQGVLSALEGGGFTGEQLAMATDVIQDLLSLGLRATTAPLVGEAAGGGEPPDVVGGRDARRGGDRGGAGVEEEKGAGGGRGAGAEEADAGGEWAWAECVCAVRVFVCVCVCVCVYVH